MNRGYDRMSRPVYPYFASSFAPLRLGVSCFSTPINVNFEAAPDS
jgi:hypothetical protein